MPQLKIYGVFISHAWRYSSDYYHLVDLINSAPNFRWRNYSVPRHDPVVDPDSDAGRRVLLRQLDDQIRPVNCVLILAGMYAAHSYWIQKEIDIAQKYGKPVIGVRPRGQQRTPLAVQLAAIEMVGWTSGSIVSAIRRRSI